MSSSDRDAAVRRPVAALPFRLHASVTCPPPAALALSLAWELGDLDGDRAERDLTSLSAAILPEAETQPRSIVASLRRYFWRSIQLSGEISTGAAVGTGSVESAALPSALLAWLKSLQLQSFGMHWPL